MDVVGRHRHPTTQPCRNCIDSFLGNPSGGIVLDPTAHFKVVCKPSVLSDMYVVGM